MKEKPRCSHPACDRTVRAKGFCHKHYMRKWYEEHPEELGRARDRMRKVPRDVMRHRRWKHLYGVTGEWYAKQLELQGGVCAICKKPETKYMKGTLMRLAVDHCHDTGLVRGLLCQACNRGIGCFSHDVTTLQSAISYLQPPTSSGQSPEGP